MLSINIIRTFSSVPKISGQAVGKKRFRLPVENDPKKLMNFCCGANYYKNGDEIKLKDDNNYPEWLWNLPLKPPRLYELNPNTKEYWEKAAIVGQQREWKLRSITNKKQMNLNPTYIERMELKYRRRFRALAKYHFNAGYDMIKHHERDDIWNMHLKDRYYLPDEPEKKLYPGMDNIHFKNGSIATKLMQKYKRAGHFGK
ncbi:mitochondrial ribosomal protein L54 [Dermatophagoides pteronyssinus]|uniref:mitochondrial ribosomal protein L54 n=1 Tax=Dermatophagoides pteronyssinus TaxID=6956 RepID=UPI003F666FF4